MTRTSQERQFIFPVFVVVKVETTDFDCQKYTLTSHSRSLYIFFFSSPLICLEQTNYAENEDTTLEFNFLPLEYSFSYFHYGHKYVTDAHKVRRGNECVLDFFFQRMRSCFFERLRAYADRNQIDFFVRFRAIFVLSLASKNAVSEYRRESISLLSRETRTNYDAHIP